LTTKLAVMAPVILVVLSFVHPWGNLRSESPGVAIESSSKETQALLSQKCGDCHSSNTHWPFYSRIAPASWLVEHDVKEGRAHLNFSRWEQYSLDERIDLLSKISSQLRQGKMPLKQYLLLHPEARLTDSERNLVVDWAKLERRRLISARNKEHTMEEERVGGR